MTTHLEKEDGESMKIKEAIMARIDLESTICRAVTAFHDLTRVKVEGVQLSRHEAIEAMSTEPIATRYEVHVVAKL